MCWCGANTWFTLLFSCIALLVVSNDTALVATGAPSSPARVLQRVSALFCIIVAMNARVCFALVS